LSDHYRPWNDRQGQSPFIWMVIGALSQAVSLPVETAVTCPRMRTHPAVIKLPPPAPLSWAAVSA
jgi:hypothetical protein